MSLHEQDFAQNSRNIDLNILKRLVAYDINHKFQL